jgi:uncharacterized membrane protein
MNDVARDAGQRLSPLTVMPLVILGSAVICDIGARVGGVGLFGIAGFYNMAAGLLTCFVALVIVLVDLVTASSGSGQRELVGAVGFAMAVMTVVFAVVWSVRSDGHRAGNAWLLAAELAALAAGAVGAWFAQGVVIGRRMYEPIQVWLPLYVPEGPAGQA